MKIAYVKLVLIFLIIITSISYPKIWIVDHNPATKPDFISIQTAINTASAGDTIYVIGSYSDYGTININKKLTLIGTGYFLDENLETQSILLSSQLSGTNTFSTGSNGSLITGFVINGRISINDDNITIKRNYILGPSNVNSTIIIPDNKKNISILQNFIIHNYSTYSPIEIGLNAYNILIINNYIWNSISSSGLALWAGSSSFISVKNNVIRGRLQIYNSSIFNNILYEGTISLFGCDVRNNIGNSTQFGTSNGNQSNVDMSSVFLLTGSSDGKYQLKVGSPAIGAGVGGVDCGMFGGSSPYVLSGMPSIPAIYYFEAPATGTNANGLPVTIKIKSHN